MMPAYNRSRWSVIYFAVYISVTLYFLMNLVRKNSISFLSLTGRNNGHVFLWQHLRFFVYFYLTMRSPKLKVACTCNSIVFSTSRALFMQNTMQFHDKIIIIIKHIPHALQKTVFNRLIFCKIISIFE